MFRSAGQSHPRTGTGFRYIETEVSVLRGVVGLWALLCEEQPYRGRCSLVQRFFTDGADQLLREDSKRTGINVTEAGQ